MRISSGMPLLPLLAAFVAGIAGMRYFQEFSVYWAAFLAALCVFARVRGWLLWSSAALFGLLGAAAMWVAVPTARCGFCSGVPQEYAGVVREVDVTPYNQRIVADVDDVAGVHRVLVHYHDLLPVVETGDRVRFCGAMCRAGDGAVVPGEFSMRGFAFRRGIVGECHTEPGNLDVVGHERSVASFFSTVRQDLSDYIFARSGLGADAASMLDAMLTGNADAVGVERREMFAGAGLAHVLALSGTHVAVLAMVVSLLFFPLRMAGHRLMEPVCVLAVLWCYVLLTGCVPSVVRTVIMVSAVACGRMLRRGSVPVNNLCLAALLILLFDPRALFAPGFQLSFSAVAAILLFRFDLFASGRVAWWVRLPGNWICVCVAAVAGSGALAAWHFHEVPLFFILANIPVAILFPWFLGGGLLLLLLQLTPLPSGWLVNAVEWLYGSIVRIADIVSSMPGASVGNVWFPWWLLIPYYGAVVAGWYALKRRRAAWGVAALLLLVFSGCGFVVWEPNRPAAEAYAMRYRHATALLVRQGSRALVLTDAPEHFHCDMRMRLDRRLGEYMGSCGIDSLEIVNAVSDSQVVYADRFCWAVGNTFIALAGRDYTGSAALPERHPVYALITGGFNGDVIRVWEELRPDTVVLSHSLHPVRRASYAALLLECGIPFREGLEGVRLLEDKKSAGMPH